MENRLATEMSSTGLKARRALTVLVAGCLFTLAACDSHPVEVQRESNEAYVVNDSSLGFDIQPLPSEGPATIWLATYASQDKTAKFRIELNASKPLDDKETHDLGMLMQTGEGRFVAEGGSDARIMLANLRRVLEAKVFPAKTQRVRSIPFTFVSFGPNESRSADGGFSTKPVGGWTPMKIFIGEEDEGEVFLNINPAMHKGEFSIKDSDYGNFVLAQLARVL
ncbi:MAG TPA: hypothetical protein VE545_04010 [Candidatus Dormibacteraeota bacterium]|nr:hypothetical protein [Candidatus Dormibacteraeota bacterium]